mmetsp:Transcript_79015/g.144057  ORF Transcript_79015/g.144057 Transcript_79015/m.144057 type:complete len:308 (+) Transcript_79015:100-1023(+)
MLIHLLTLLVCVGHARRLQTLRESTRCNLRIRKLFTALNLDTTSKSHLWRETSAALSENTSRGQQEIPDSSRPRYLRLRGGSDEDDGGDSDEGTGGNKLTWKQIHEKLNTVPTFVLVDEEKNLVPLQIDEDEEPTFRFFIDAGEAEAVLEMTRKVLGTGVHLGVMSLGVAFKACERSQPGARFKLQGPRKALEEFADVVKEKLKVQGIEAGDWLLPVFCSDDFQNPSLYPIFFSIDDLESAWVRSGKSQEELMFLTTTAMDLRSLVVNMEHSDAMPWSIFQLATSPESYARAQAIMAKDKKKKQTQD